MAFRIFLRPTGFIESPQRFDGAGARLAGTMLWFTQIEIFGDVERRLIDVSDWGSAKADLPEKAQTIFARLTSPRTALQMGARTVRLDQPQVMGILNCTPDSFSDGGKHGDDPVAVGVAMAGAGAAIVDVGGESTRPGAPLIWEGDEIKRVEPVIHQLAASGTAVSIDTRKAAVMQAALSAGAAMINDISALLYDDQSIEITKASTCPVVLMHAPSQSSDPHKGGEYDDVLTEVYDWLEERVDAVEGSGISRDRILIDPGVGFGKSLADNLTLINNLSLFHGIGCPILFGASRKRLIGALSNEASTEERLGGSVYLAMKAVEQGAHIVRVHDVPETVQAVRVWRGLRDAALTARS